MTEDSGSRWMSQRPEELPGRQFQFSLAVLMRALVIIGGLLGFIVSVAVTNPQYLFLAIFLPGCVLAAIIAKRRRGTPGQRGLALVGFVLNSLIVALYGASLATVLQTTDDSPENWTGLGTAISLLALILATPAMAVVVVLMLRSWTWSANDADMHAHSRGPMK